jgi:hypothetical protein
MSLVEDEMSRQNALRAEDRRKADAEHMAEMAKQSAMVIPKDTIKENWDKRLERREQLQGIHKILGLISRE